jgi:hypothetical protein
MKLKKLLVLLLLLSAAFVLSACGEQGIQGETGDQGATGETGAQGAKGQTGDTGAQGAKGNTGASGVGIEFSSGIEGILWRYKGATDWNTAVTYEEVFEIMNDFGANKEANANVKATSFDYYVSTRLAEEANGASVEAYGKTFTVATNAFGTIGAALEAAKTASAVEGYKGKSIFVDAGEYEEYLVVETKNITLLGHNFGIDPRNETRGDETILSGCLEVEGENFTLNGFQLSGTNSSDAATAALAVEGTKLTAEAAKANILLRAAGAHLCYNNTSDSNKKQYMITLGAGSSDVISDVEIDHNEIYPKRIGGDVRPVRNTAGTVSNFYFHDNKMKNDGPEGELSDAIRLNNISGYVRITDNYCDWNSNNWGFFIAPTTNNASEITVTGNFLGATADENYCSGIAIRNIPASGQAINVSYNTLYNVSGTNIQMKFAADIASENPTTIDVQYNKYYTLSKSGVTAITLDKTSFKTATTTVFNNIYSDVTLTADNSNIVPASTYATADLVPAKPADGYIGKYAALLTTLAEAFVADFNAATGKSISDITKIDTAHMDSVDIVTMYTNADAKAKWGWLFDAIGNLDKEHATSDPDFDMTNHKGYYLSNINAFFTSSQHKDTYLEYDSFDFSTGNYTMIVLVQYRG